MRYIIVRFFMVTQYFVRLKYTWLVFRFAPLNFAIVQLSFSIYFYTDMCIHACSHLRNCDSFFRSFFFFAACVPLVLRGYFENVGVTRRTCSTWEVWRRTLVSSAKSSNEWVFFCPTVPFIFLRERLNVPPIATTDWSEGQKCDICYYWYWLLIFNSISDIYTLLSGTYYYKFFILKRIFFWNLEDNFNMLIPWANVIYTPYSTYD